HPETEGRRKHGEGRGAADRRVWQPYDEFHGTGCTGAGRRRREIHDSRRNRPDQQGGADVRARRSRRNGGSDRVERLPGNFREQGERSEDARSRARRGSDRRTRVGTETTDELWI